MAPVLPLRLSKVITPAGAFWARPKNKPTATQRKPNCLIAILLEKVHLLDIAIHRLYVVSPAGHCAGWRRRPLVTSCHEVLPFCGSWFCLWTISNVLFLGQSKLISTDKTSFVLALGEMLNGRR